MSTVASVYCLYLGGYDIPHSSIHICLCLRCGVYSCVYAQLFYHFSRHLNVHLLYSHYHMQAARSMQHGRQKGLMARHSSQGSRLQASRIAAKEMQRVHGKGMKVGKTSKKSNQKRRGEAGGSKKSGGTSSEK